LYKGIEELAFLIYNNKQNNLNRRLDQMRQISLRAPGKINWTLDIMGRRPDGYHEVRMLMQSVDLYDEITIMAGGTGITVVSDFEGMPLDERNTAWKAAALLMDMAGASEGVKISINKRIPMAAGMAGGSADAAGVLVGLNELWGLGLNVSQLEAIGLEVGADVPFCIAGGTAIAEGIGEMLTRLEPIEGIWLVVVKPPFGVSTAEVYKAFRMDKNNRHNDTEDIYQKLKAGDFKGLAATGLSNALEQVTVSMHPEIAAIKEELLSLGAAVSLMTGSGPAVYGVFEDQAAARFAQDHMKKTYFQTYLTRTRGKGIELI